MRGALERLKPAVVVTTTAFAACGEGEGSPLDATDASRPASGDRNDGVLQEARLADAGLPHEQNDLPRTLAGLAPAVEQ